jgi:precorrin-8X/cobalt-precorrin-8 methylmutase
VSGGAATLFDSYVVVDWSARAEPCTGPDSIWIAIADGDRRPQLANPSTRRRAEEQLLALFDARPASRVLVGVDAALGYPAGTAARFGLGDPPWETTWGELARLGVDDERNRNNRFEVAATLNVRAGPGAGPFWGCPSGVADSRLGTTKPADLGLPEFRAAERALRASGWRPHSVWQLLGAGSVGGQTLTVLPVLERLRAELASRVDVWPFTTGLRPPVTTPGTVVVVEVWPTRFVDTVPAGMVRDAIQVTATVAALRRADRSGELVGWFEPQVGAERAAVEREEGWVLGPP